MRKKSHYSPMKTRLFWLLSLLCLACEKIYAYTEPRMTRYDPASRDASLLPDGSTVGIGLAIAVITIPIGFLILNSKKDKDSSSELGFAGCLGTILVFGGIVCLFPLFAWLSTIAYSIMWIGIAIAIVLGIIVFICSLFSK